MARKQKTGERRWSHISVKPEKISLENLPIVERGYALLLADDHEAFHTEIVMNDAAAELWFWYVVNWPEGKNYCANKEYLRLTAFPALRRHDLPGIRDGIAKVKELNYNAYCERERIKANEARATYRIVRMYKDATPNHRVILRGLTIAEAKAHCGSPEASSKTCTSTAGRARTKRLGAWFDGFEQE